MQRIDILKTVSIRLFDSAPFAGILLNAKALRRGSDINIRVTSAAGASCHFIEMERLPKTKEEIERLVVAEMHTFAECEYALAVTVIPIVNCADAATWTVSRFNPGKSDGEACDGALQLIVPRFQRAYDIIRRH